MAGIALGYCRVSTVEQADSGLSIDHQRQAIAAYTAMRGLELLDIYSDPGVSAGVPLAERPGGARLLADLRRGSQVVALKLDRLFRDCSECLDTTRSWERGGVALHLVDMGGQAIDTSSAVGRFFLTVMAGAAEMERNLICERTKTAMRQKIRRGEYTGGIAPWGSVVADGRTEPLPEVLAQVRKMRAAGDSYRAIARELNTHHRNVRRFVQRHLELI